MIWEVKGGIIGGVLQDVPRGGRLGKPQENFVQNKVSHLSLEPNVPLNTRQNVPMSG